MISYFKRKSIPKSQYIDQTNTFQGLSLEQWHYLGYTTLTLDNVESIIHLFCKKDDFSKRAYRIQGTATQKKTLRHTIPIFMVLSNLGS